MTAVKHRLMGFVLSAFVLSAIGVAFSVTSASRQVLHGQFKGLPVGANSFLPDFFRSPQGILRQFKPDGVAAIPEGGMITAGTVVFGISFPSTVLMPLRLQIEVRPSSVAFTGAPTSVSGIFLFTQNKTIAVSKLAAGNYHWRARLANVFTGTVSNWQEFGIPGNTDFIVALREPVLIVPGVAGTMLQKAFDGTEVWPDVSKMIVSPSDNYLDALTLDISGNDPESSIRAASILASALPRTIPNSWMLSTPSSRISNRPASGRPFG